VRAQKLALVGTQARARASSVLKTAPSKGVAERAYQPAISGRDQVTIRYDWLVHPNASRFLNQIF